MWFSCIFIVQLKILFFRDQFYEFSIQTKGLTFEKLVQFLTGVSIYYFAIADGNFLQDGPRSLFQVISFKKLQIHI